MWPLGQTRQTGMELGRSFACYESPSISVVRASCTERHGFDSC